MSQLKDYSGKFKPDLKLQDFSEEALRRLWKCGGDLYSGMSTLYFNLIKEKFGEEKAVEFSREIWLKRGACEQEVRLCREALNIWGNDVESFFKQCQIDPAFGPFIEAEWELKNKNDGILTVKRCMVYEKWRENVPMQKYICEEVEVVGFSLSAHQYDPKMKAIPLKLPPAKGNEIVCQWEFKIE